MVEYIKNYIDLVIASVPDASKQPVRPDGKIYSLQTAFQEIAKELNAMDARDFEPCVQTQFLRVRGNISCYANQKLTTAEENVERTLRPLKDILDHYRGIGSGRVTRVFSYITDPELRSIVERDYAELIVKVYPSGAWKSTVILAGSILEAILSDRLADPKWNAIALKNGKAPQKAGTAQPLENWTLEKLIDVATDIGVLKKDPADTIHQVLRDYRNFVHPRKEIRAAHPCTDAEAMLAVGALNSVCNHVEANP